MKDFASNRKTFAIISHPDAGKTTITEKLLLLGNIIQIAGTVRARKSDRHAVSDWMAIEKERGISVTSSVMQFPYEDFIVNLLDTPGHEDFSEDTYRTLTAVDSALMVLDGAKGVENRTIKLMDVCRLRDTPIITFINKMDRDIRDPIELLDEIESVLKIRVAPINWPIGMGKHFLGTLNLISNKIFLYKKNDISMDRCIQLNDIYDPSAKGVLGDAYEDFVAELELIKGAGSSFTNDQFLSGELTPVFFGTALGDFGVREMLDYFIKWAPEPQARQTDVRAVSASEDLFSGFVFKIQANMDPKHRDRMAFLRICSGKYKKGMKIKQVRTGKLMRISDAVGFKAGTRISLDAAEAGDIIGFHNHGSIQIGDTFTEGEQLRFAGIPYFAPELFKRIRLRDPLKAKQLRMGIKQLSEEGSMQVFFPLENNDIIVGAIGQLQFDLVVHRLKSEYSVDADYEPVNVNSARWISSSDQKVLEMFKRKTRSYLALDGGDCLAYLAPTSVNMSLAKEKNPEIKFTSTREH